MVFSDLYLRLGSIVYALSKLDGRLQQAEVRVVNDLLRQEPFGHIALSAFFLRENSDETVEEAYAFGIRRLADPRIVFPAQTKKRFVTILLRVAQAHEGISGQERSFIWQFSQEIKSL